MPPRPVQEHVPIYYRDDGKHIIVSEVASAYHSWVIGALDSAVHSVSKFLYRHFKRDRAVWDAAKLWDVTTANESHAIQDGLYGPLHAESGCIEMLFSLSLSTFAFIFKGQIA